MIFPLRATRADAPGIQPLVTYSCSRESMRASRSADMPAAAGEASCRVVPLTATAGATGALVVAVWAPAGARAAEKSRGRRIFFIIVVLCLIKIAFSEV